MSDYQLVRFRPDLASQVARLQRHLWGPDVAINARYLEWKHLQNPYASEPDVYLALHGGRVVAMRGMFGARWEIGSSGDPAFMPCASDLVIDPAYRDRGLFRELTEYALGDLESRGCEYVLNLSANHANFVASVVLLGWRAVGSLGPLVRTAGRKPLGRAAWLGRELARKMGLKRRVVDLGITKRAAARAWGSWDRSTGRFAGSAISSSDRPRPEAMAKLVERIGSDGRARHVRDETYFSWRFRNPRSAYRFLYWGSDRLQGYLVLEKTGYLSSVSIVDWEASDPEIRAELLSAAAQSRFPKLESWSATLSDETIALLRNAGFAAEHELRSPERYSKRFMLRSVRAGGAGDWHLRGRNLLDLNSWDLRMIYSDAH